MSDATNSKGEIYLSIDMLQEKNIIIAHITKLKEANYCTVQRVAYTLPKELTKQTGISEKIMQQIQDAAYKLLAANMGFITATEYYKKRQDVVKITTGSTRLNKILGGG
eukprot:323306_1